MFDWVPIQAWLIILLAILAYQPALTVFRFAASSQGGDDLFPRPTDQVRPERDQFGRSLFVLIALAGLAAFIFTSAAERFSKSPSFWPAVMGVIGLFALYSTIAGAVRGSVEPFIKGNFGPYDRDDQPVQYWLSMVWNVGMVVLLMSAIFWIPESP